MLSTVRMKQLIAVVLDVDAETVTEELLRSGLLHLVKLREFDRTAGDKLEPVAPKIADERIRETRSRVESFLQLAGARALTATFGEAAWKPIDLEQTNKQLDKIAAGVERVRDKQRSIQQELNRLEDIRRHVELYKKIGPQMRSNAEYSFLMIRVGSVPSPKSETLVAALGQIPSIRLVLGQDGDRTNMLVVTMKRDEAKLDAYLAEHDWTDVELPEGSESLKGELLGDLDKRISAGRQTQRELSIEVSQQAESQREMLVQIWRNLRLHELHNRVQSNFSRTSRTVMFSGWMPAAKQKVLGDRLQSVTQGRCYLEWHDPAPDTQAETSVPVQFKNPSFLAPFQRIVQNYAVPEYGTIDPTPLVAIAYLSMFGMMFGDAGHGLVLILAGLLGLGIYRRKGQSVPQLLYLVVWCGFSAVLFGVLFGSYFGMGWFEPLWFDFHGAVVGQAETTGYVKDIYGVLVITIYFGISIVALGILLNWVNLVARGEWLKLMLDKGGLLGGWMYAGGVYVGYYFVDHAYRELPGMSVLFAFFGVPALLLTLKPPLEYLRSPARERKKLSVLLLMDFFMEWVVELLEIFSGYLANTLSFMRVAGLGIAHVSLMVAFFAMAAMVAQPSSGFSVWSYAVLVLGNLLVIGLEGLSAGIQSLRLNYYEFFSKYFHGSGAVYSPISLDSRD